MEIDQEKMEKNYYKLLKLAKLSKKENLEKLVEDFGERYALAPASTREEYFNCYPGGLIDHTLGVVKVMKNLKDSLKVDVPLESIVTVAVLHCIGKVGDMQEDYYVPTKKAWQVERGQNYEINDKISFMKIPHRSLFLAQAYNIVLSQDEYLAIMLHEGLSDQSNDAYRYKQPELSKLLQHAISWADLER